MTSATVIRDRFVRGWPAHEEGERAYLLPLGDALERPYTTDAHFAAYATPNGRRLTSKCFELGVTVEMNAIVFDLDGPGHAASAEWRAETRSKVTALAAVHPDPYFYETRGGARLVFAQSEPMVLSSADDARGWSRLYSVAIAYLSRRFGLEADPACADWTRLFRLPRATRDEGGRPENLPVLGSPDRIGDLFIEAAPEDVEAARRASKAWREPRSRPLTPSTSDGYGLFYYALRARGDLGREHDRGSFVIRCPGESDHTSGQTGDGSTLLYLPAPGAELGCVHCLHAHCAGRSVREWLRCFTDPEIEAARQQAGIAPRSRRAA